MSFNRVDLGFPNRLGSDSRCWLGWRPACDGSTVFFGSSRAGGWSGGEGGSELPRGSATVRGGRGDGDQLGASVAGDRERGAGPDGGSQAEGDRRRAPHLACAADPGAGLHPARLGGRAGRARPRGRLPLGLELRSRREAELQKKAWWLANATVLTSPTGGRNGRSIRTGSSRSAWSSSTRPGPRPTWRRCGAGRPGGSGSPPRSRTAT